MLNVSILDALENMSRSSAPAPLAMSDAYSYGAGAQLITDAHFRVIFQEVVDTSTPAKNIGESLACFANRQNTGFHSRDRKKIWFGAANGTTPANKCILFDLEAESVTFDDAGARGFTSIIIDNIGTVWAISTVGFGLYKRTAAATWTQVLSDSGLGTMNYKPADDSYWYRSATGNYYQLANGLATVSAAPSGGMRSISENSPNFDEPTITNLSFITGVTAKKADGSAYPGIPIPADLFFAAGDSYTSPPMQMHLDSTYSLLAISVAQTNRQFINVTNYNRPHWILVLFNRQTLGFQLIGFLPPPVIVRIWKSAASSITAFSTEANMPFFSKWHNGCLRIYFAGRICFSTVKTSPPFDGTAGILSVDIPCEPTI